MTDADLTLQPQRRASRYRAQRSHVQQDTPPVPSIQSTSSSLSLQDPLARSRSRYRQQKAQSETSNGRDAEHSRTPAVPEIPKAQLPEASTQQRPSLTLATTNTSTSSTRITRASKPRSLRREHSYDDHFSPPSPAITRRVDSGTTLHSSPSQNSMRQKQSSNIRSRQPQSPPTAGQLYPPLQSPPPPLQPPSLKLDGPPKSSEIRATGPKDILPGEKSKRSGFGLFKRKPERSDAQPSKSAAPIKWSSDEVVNDAPISAVNAGQRRVLLECGAYKMMYPVTPTTTPVDLIKSAAITMSNPVNVKSAVLLEYFGSVGVHRAIRRYEHIRDVMNSWDHDAQNSLLLIDPGTSSSETELSLSGAPKTKPRESTWRLYYSQAVGKWDKRIVHLKRDGQLTIQKDPSKPNEQLNVCHLSDFDIYTPTQDKIKKKIRPPKKHCHAIKSQQKSSMFEDTATFVHFFCASEKSVADDFHAAVQSWRSWYLVHVMEQGNHDHHASTPTDNHNPAASTPNHRRIDSVESHYQLGTFSPLVDLDHFNQKRLSSYGGVPSRSRKDRPARQPTQENLADDEPLANFAPKSSSRMGTTSLGRSQTKNRQPSAGADITNIHRPLVDLTAQKRPQSRKGCGYDSAAGSGLINEARNPNHEEPNIISHARQSSDLVPGSIGRAQSIRRSRPSISADDEAFTGDGLLAQTQDGWGNGSRGRGVLDGSHADGPMLELSEQDRFAQGSLLQQVERRQGPRQPIIDRARTVERNVKTGERC